MNTIKKLIFAIVVALVFGLRAQAQTLHGIIIADTYDDKIGESTVVDSEGMMLELRTTAQVLNMKENIIELKDNDFTKAKTLEVLNGLKCGKDDIVFFYYTGHGVRSPQDQSKYPQLALKELKNGNLETSGRALLSFDEVKNIIQAKNARLSIIFSDCCNAIQDGLPPQYANNSGNTSVSNSENIAMVYQNLFMKTRGIIMATSSKPGEVSLGNMANGGAFTFAYRYVLQRVVGGDVKASWQEILDATQGLCNKINSQQTPVFDVAVQTAGGAQASTPPPPSNTNTTTSEDTSSIYIKKLKAIGDRKVSKAARIKQIKPTFAEIFENEDAKVWVIGRDGKTILDKYAARDYITRLSTITSLVELIELDVQKGMSGKIVTLIVQEVHEIK
jgi:hypothetical protein